MAIDATVGGSDANSYVTADDAETYFSTRFDSGSWQSATDGEKSGSLLSATNLLEQREWNGTAVTSTQALHWPRNGIPKRVGFTFESNTAIPQRIKNAQMELAFALVEQTIDLSPSNDAFDGALRIGPITIPKKIRGAKTRWPAIVGRELTGLLTFDGPRTVRA